MSEPIMHLSPLSPAHQARLEASGIDPATIQARGYYTGSSGAALGRLGFARNQLQIPALVLPIYGLKGRTKLYQTRPDQPRINKGREVKYETPYGAKLLLDIPPGVVTKVLDPDIPLVITEGVFKADSAASRGLACIASLGVHGWGGDLETWDAIPLGGRRVLVAFDSDICTKSAVRSAADQLATFLKRRGASVEFILFPGAADGSKVGLDDYLASGKDVAEFFSLSVTDLPEASDEDAEAREGPARYETTDDGIFKITGGKKGENRAMLANFTARITAELTYVENPARAREFEIEAKLNGKVTSVVVTALEFERMNWVIELLGAGAIIGAGQCVRDELRAAIQFNSGQIPRLNGFDRLGWADLRGDGSEWGFIHAGGVIRAEKSGASADSHKNRPEQNPSEDNHLRHDGPKRPIAGPTSELPEIRVHHLSSTLSRYNLPAPPEGDLLRNAIRISLGFLDLAPDRITFPLYAGMWRVLLDVVRFSLFIVGPSGIGKTELAAALVQHFGSGLDSEHPTDSFISTAYSTASSAHQAGNVVYLLDDYVPGGSAGKDQRLQDHAEHLIRSQGNRVGRNRCNRDGSTQGGRESRALYCITGEASPHGESLGARYLNLEAQPGDILDLLPEDTTKSEKLGLYQQLARQGYPAMATAAFLQFIAPDYERHRSELHQQKQAARETSFRGKAVHPRVVDIAADLLAGLEVFMLFAVEVGAIDDAEAETLWQRAHEALWETLKAQDRHHVEQDPARRLLGLLGSAMTTGRAHLLTLADDGHKFEWGSPKIWGYEEKEIKVYSAPPEAPGRDDGSANDSQNPRVGSGGDEDFVLETVLVPRGDQIGWRHCDNLFFDPDRALGVAQRIAWEAGEPRLSPGKKALGKRLDKLGLLASKEPDRNTARPLIDGKKTDAWHIRVNKFYEFIDPCEEHWETRRDRDALAGHEEAGRRQEELKKVRDARFRKAATYMQGQFLKLLDPVSLPADQTVADPVSEEQPTARPSSVADADGPSAVQDLPDIADGSGPSIPHRPENSFDARPIQDDFLLD